MFSFKNYICILQECRQFMCYSDNKFMFCKGKKNFDWKMGKFFYHTISTNVIFVFFKHVNFNNNVYKFFTSDKCFVI